MGKRLIQCALFFFVLIFTISSSAWNAAGHMLIAKIAYDHLKPEVRKQVDLMTADLAKEYPQINSFVSLAPWPDMLRSQKIMIFSHWHYIDIPFSADGTPIKNIADSDNAIWAINQIEGIVKNSKTNPYERARFLAFLIHIVGDMHQPLHTVGRISASHPDGDHGGNLYTVRFQGQTSNLHAIWDNGFGLFSQSENDSSVAELATTLSNAYPEAYFGEKAEDLSPENWAKEGGDLARTFVYGTPENFSPGVNYIGSGKKIAEQQVTLAGYRLAHLLNFLLSS